MKRSMWVTGGVLVGALILSRPWVRSEERAALVPTDETVDGVVEDKLPVGPVTEVGKREGAVATHVEALDASPRSFVDLARQIQEIEVAVDAYTREGMLEGALRIKRLVEAEQLSAAEVLAACEVDEPTWGLVFLRAFALPSEETDDWVTAVAEGDAGKRPKDASVAAGLATALFGGVGAKRRLFELNFQRSPSSLGIDRPGWLPMDLLRGVEPAEIDSWVGAIRSGEQLDVFGEAALESVSARLGTPQVRHALIDGATSGDDSPALFARLIEDPELTAPLGVLANRAIPAGPGPGPARVANAKKAAFAGLLRIGTNESIQLVFDSIAERGGRFGPDSPNSCFQGRPLPRIFPKLLQQLAAIPSGTQADTNVHRYLERTAAEIPGMILANGDEAGRALLEELRHHPSPGDERAAAAYNAVIAELEKWL